MTGAPQATNVDEHLRLTEFECRAVRELARTVEYEPDHEIFAVGDVGDCMYLVVSGEVEIRFEEQLPAKRLPERSMFGELSLIIGEHRRTASAVTAGKCEVAVIDEPAFEELVKKNPQLLTSILRRACRYLLNSEQQLVAELRLRNEKLRKTLDFLRVTQEELDYQELLAQTDELTGLYNRRCLNEQLPHFINRSLLSGKPMALILADLDNLKPINDQYGHAAGDRVLLEVSRALGQSIRHSDLACRIGGDEFAIVLPEIAVEDAQLRADEIRSAFAGVSAPGSEGVAILQITASLGVSLVHEEESVEDLLARTDQALYAAKEQGGDCVVWSGDEPEQG